MRFPGRLPATTGRMLDAICRSWISRLAQLSDSLEALLKGPCWDQSRAGNAHANPLCRCFSSGSKFAVIQRR